MWDIFCGMLDDSNNIIVYGHAKRLNTISSTLMSQIERQLKTNQWITDESFNNDGFDYIDTTEKAKLPDIAYHGTCSKYLTNILRMGLIHDKSRDNWERVKRNEAHERTIFLTTHNTTVLFHANNCVAKNGTQPIILEFEIPDKDLVVQDFDMERATGTTDDSVIRYVKSKTPVTDKKSFSYKPFTLSRELGVYGYAGRIPASFIKAVWVPKIKKAHNEKYIQSDFIKLNPKEALKHLGLFN
jgi:hypothetical protein